MNTLHIKTYGAYQISKFYSGLGGGPFFKGPFDLGILKCGLGLVISFLGNTATLPLGQIVIFYCQWPKRAQSAQEPIREGPPSPKNQKGICFARGFESTLLATPEGNRANLQAPFLSVLAHVQKNLF